MVVDFLAFSSTKGWSDIKNVYFPSLIKTSITCKNQLKPTIDVKGVTPVIAVVVLIAVTLGLGATLYVAMVDLQDGVETETDVANNLAGITINSCWDDEDSAYLSITNDGDRVVDLTDITGYAEGDELTLIEEEQFLEPSETSSIEIDEGLEPQAIVELNMRGDSLEHVCQNTEGEAI